MPRMAQTSIRVEGLRKLSRTIADSNEEIDHWLKDGLLEIGERVAVDVRSAYSVYSVPGADGVKAKVWRTGTTLVAQTMRRGRDMNRRRPNFGGLMMRKAFLPALDKNKDDAERAAERLLDEIAVRWSE